MTGKSPQCLPCSPFHLIVQIIFTETDLYLEQKIQNYLKHRQQKRGVVRIIPNKIKEMC